MTSLGGIEEAFNIGGHLDLEAFGHGTRYGATALSEPGDFGCDGLRRTNGRPES
jgi:hypothetical protein